MNENILIKKIFNNRIIYLFNKGLLSIKKLGFRETYKIIKKKINDRKLYHSVKDNIFNNNEYQAYESEYQDDIDFTNYQTIVKTIVFYLPQFHRIMENDKWWGDGFTEWTNTKKTTPRFNEHYQPREPHDDIGYYDLSNIETLKKQSLLAKKHGIYGFCFYYYWFSGKWLLEKPIDMLLEHKEIDINFCLCWANENWTRKWDGANSDVLMQQKYLKDDPIRFIEDIKKYIDDPRYIKIDNKPIIIVYNPGEIFEIKKVFNIWRVRAKEIGIGEILIWTCRTNNNTAKIINISNIIDAEVEFPPNNCWYKTIEVRNINTYNKSAYINNYQKLVEIINKRIQSEKRSKKPIYRCAMLGWDNAARRENEWTTFYAYSLKAFYKWVNLNITDAFKRLKINERLIFINAWNEWAEGTYLEPDKKYGYANINTLSKAICSLPFDNNLKIIKENNIEIKRNLKIAVHVHIFYVELTEEIIENLLYIPYNFDCFITTDSLNKRLQIEEIFKKYNIINMLNIIIEIFENRGRDVAPFMFQLKNNYINYDYICHLHSKKNGKSEYGDYWRKYLYKHLLGSNDNITGIIESFEKNNKIGIIFPETYPVISKQAEWGDNINGCYNILNRLGIYSKLPGDIIFPAGNMFWARVDAISDIFKTNYNLNDFEEENGQINNTLAHQIERIWVYIAKNKKYLYLKTFNNTSEVIKTIEKEKIIFYAHYDKNNIISEQDKESIINFSKFSKELIFVTNSNLSDDEISNIKPYTSKIIKRKNKGFDFAAWRDGLIQYGFKNLSNFDQLILINNSVLSPIYNMNNIFNKMNNKNIDFWGITLFPELSDGSYLKKEKISEHIQSYFQVFNKNVFTNNIFIEFWKSVKNIATLKSVISLYESELTSILKKAGFKYSVLIEETRFISKYLMDYSIPYTNPYALVLLGSPFIKKKCENYVYSDGRSRIAQFISQL